MAFRSFHHKTSPSSLFLLCPILVLIKKTEIPVSLILGCPLSGLVWRVAGRGDDREEKKKEFEIPLLWQFHTLEVVTLHL